MEITFLCPAMARPTGGVKVIYKYAELLSANGVKASVMHPGNDRFTCTWFDHSAPIRRGRPIDPENDFLVIPEVWALAHAEKFKKIGLSYAVFVQNGYLLNWGVQQTDYPQLFAAYDGAKLIMSISEDTSRVISLAFPTLDKKKIIRLLPHIGKGFHATRKKKIISFMPRKLPEHSKKVCFMLRHHLRSDWSLASIDNCSEQKVMSILAESSIFLSFCDQEGCPLPPLEASLSGTLVIGYTGQGAKEYFREPNFREIQNGDFQSFVKVIAQGIEDVESGLLDCSNFLEGISRLRDSYGEEREG